MEAEGTYDNRMRFFLKDRGKTAKSVAAELGVSTRMLTYYQQGRVAMPVEYRQRLARILKASVEDIFPRNVAPDRRTPSTASSIERVTTRRSPLVHVEQTLPIVRAERMMVVPTAMPSIGESGYLDWPTWFAQRIAAMQDLVSYWGEVERSYYRLQWTMHQEMDMWNTMAQQQQHTDNVVTISRRTALATLAVISTTLLAAMRGDRPTPAMIDAFLARCTASITSCWHLLMGDGLATVEYVVPQYLPILETLAQRPGKYQKQAANLAAQGCLIMGLIAMHRVQFAVRLEYNRRAVQHSAIADDPTLKVTTLAILALAHYYQGDRSHSVQIYGQALAMIETNPQAVSPLIQSKVFSEAAPSYAQDGQTQRALRCMSTAIDLFPEQPDPERDPCFIVNDHGPGSLALWQGITYNHLGQNATYQGTQPSKLLQQAWQSLTKIETMPQHVVIPERIRVEIINHQAATAIAQRDLQRFTTYFVQGVQGAKALGSGKRLQEATANWKAARVAWPGEPAVNELVELFL